MTATRAEVAKETNKLEAVHVAEQVHEQVAEKVIAQVLETVQQQVTEAVQEQGVNAEKLQEKVEGYQAEFVTMTQNRIGALAVLYSPIQQIGSGVVPSVASIPRQYQRRRCR